ncbi:unnamed protein product [Symbiodinium sp. CCMP2592]|nr:unnamed protein product [Symbiodinium sp. CCMP2592]
MVTLDLSQAFDRIPRELLYQGMCDMQLPEDLISIIMAWHSSIAYTVHHAGESRTFPATRGVRQGCSASPLLWLIFSHATSTRLEASIGYSTLCQMLTIFADDYHAAGTFSTLHELEQLLGCISLLFKVLKSFGMQVSDAKSKAILAIRGTLSTSIRKKFVRKGPDGLVLRIPQLQGSLCIPLVSEFTHLGVRISYTSFENATLHQRMNKGKATFSRLGTVLKGKHNLSIAHRLCLWKACVWSTISYGLITCGLTAEGHKSLETLVVKQLRAILRQPAHLTHTTNSEVLAEAGFTLPGAALAKMLDREAHRRQGCTDLHVSLLTGLRQSCQGQCERLSVGASRSQQTETEEERPPKAAKMGQNPAQGKRGRQADNSSFNGGQGPPWKGQGKGKGKASSQTTALVRAMGRLIIRQETQLQVLKQNSAWMVYLKPGASGPIPVLFQAAEKYKEQAAKEKGWMTDEGHWCYQKWDSTNQVLQVDEDRAPVPHQDVVGLSQKMAGLVLAKDVVHRFNATHPISADKEGTAVFFLEIGLRAKGVMEAWEGLEVMTNLAALQLIGMQGKRESLRRSNLADEVQKLLSSYTGWQRPASRTDIAQFMCHALNLMRPPVLEGGWESRLVTGDAVTQVATGTLHSPIRLSLHPQHCTVQDCVDCWHAQASPIISALKAAPDYLFLQLDRHAPGDKDVLQQPMAIPSTLALPVFGPRDTCFRAAYHAVAFILRSDADEHTSYTALLRSKTDCGRGSCLATCDGRRAVHLSAIPAHASAQCHIIALIRSHLLR